MEKIYYTLDTRIPKTLYIQFKGVTAHVGLELSSGAIEARENGKPLSEEEEIVLASDYLEAIVGVKRRN